MFEFPAFPFLLIRGRVNDAEDPETALKDFIARQKMGRVGTPAEIAAIAVHFASNEVNLKSPNLDITTVYFKEVAPLMFQNIALKCHKETAYFQLFQSF